MQTETNHEVPFVIHFDYFPGEEQTFDHPGSPEQVEITKVSLYGTDLNQDQTKAFIEDYGIVHLDELCLDAVRDAKKEAEYERSEAAYEARLESFIPCPF